MQGSLDDPPIVIYSTRMTSALLLLVCVGFVAGCVWMLNDPAITQRAMQSGPAISRGARNLWLAEPAAYLGIAFFGLGIPISGWRLVRPDILILTPQGIDWHAFGRKRHFGWDDVHSFRTWAPAGIYWVRFSRMARFPAQSNSLKSTIDESFGGGWELYAEDLADLLNEARARWRQGRT